jgi:L-2-hydroxyglutarate oxidase LhgO
MDRIDVLVVGAGVVGLACARALAQAGHEVVIAEAQPRFGTGVSSRNSEVIHAGIYHPPGSLKARLCVRGKALLYDYCAARGIAHRRLGKLVVAVRDADVARLDAIRQRAADCGVDDLRLIDGAAARALEPALACAAALQSPSSGIVASHELMTALLGDAEAHGAALAVASAVRSARRRDGAWAVTADGGFELAARWIVNAAGLDAQAVAAAIDGLPPAAIPRRHLARGHYFALAGRAPFGRLIYPLPVDGGLGVHLTLDLGGQARFGPDVEWFESDAPGDALDYTVDATRATAFDAAVRDWWPGLPRDALVPATTGIRPKISGPGEPAADFRIGGPADHGCAGLVNLFGIESPGLTASLAIAEVVAGLVKENA